MPIKRILSNPGTGILKKCKKYPAIGSSILVDTAESSGVYRVHSKNSDSDSDFMYCLTKDNKQYIFILKRVN